MVESARHREQGCLNQQESAQSFLDCMQVLTGDEGQGEIGKRDLTCTRQVARVNDIVYVWDIHFCEWIYVAATFGKSVFNTRYTLL
jgi:hypothetical protein